MRILFLNQAPKTGKVQATLRRCQDREAAEQLRDARAPRSRSGFPTPYEGSQLYRDDRRRRAALNGLHHMMETPAIIKKIFWAAENGYDAVISSNTFDPGVDGGRLAVVDPGDRPVAHLGARRRRAGRPDRHHRAAARHVPYTWRILRAYGLDRFVTDIKPIGVYTDVQKRKAEIFDIDRPS